MVDKPSEEGEKVEIPPKKTGETVEGQNAATDPVVDVVQDQARKLLTLLLQREGITYLSKEQLAEALALDDLTEDKNGPNPLSIIFHKIEEGLRTAGYPNPEIRRASPVTTVRDNFDQLLFPADSLSRSPMYTKYIDPDHLLRTHTSSMIPDILRERPTPEDRVVLCPGICFRRDVVDKIHTGAPHQLDIWRIKKGSQKMGRKELLELVEIVLRSIIPDPVYRINETSHPYTQNGIEVEIFKNGQWLEIFEAGEIHPTLLANSGLDPNEYSGLASGFGLERLAMMVKGVDDIRIFRSKEPRILRQMQTLEPYKEVSKMPAIQRDISIVVAGTATVEDICEKVLGIGTEAGLIEEIKILSETPVEDLSSVARERLGAKEGQKNILLRLVIRSVDRTLRKEEADIIRDKSYLAVHESPVKTLIRKE